MSNSNQNVNKNGIHFFLSCFALFHLFFEDYTLSGSYETLTFEKISLTSYILRNSIKKMIFRSILFVIFRNVLIYNSPQATKQGGVSFNTADPVFFFH